MVYCVLRGFTDFVLCVHHVMMSVVRLFHNGAVALSAMYMYILIPLYALNERSSVCFHAIQISKE